MAYCCRSLANLCKNARLRQEPMRNHRLKSTCTGPHTWVTVVNKGNHSRTKHAIILVVTVAGWGVDPKSYLRKNIFPNLHCAIAHPSILQASYYKHGNICSVNIICTPPKVHWTWKLNRLTSTIWFQSTLQRIDDIMASISRFKRQRCIHQS